MDAVTLNAIGYDIINASFKVRSEAGWSMREHFYKHALAYELKLLGHKVTMEQCLPVIYKNVRISDSYYMDLVVDDCVVVEIKAMKYIGNNEIRQIQTYLKLSTFKLGYIINFGAEDFRTAKSKEIFSPKIGIYRFVNNL